MADAYKILLVEDSPDDEMLIRRYLSKHLDNLSMQRVENMAEFASALAQNEWDIIISDYTLPAFSAQAVLFYLVNSQIDLHVIVVSGKAGEETAVEVMRWGAKDFICKNNLQRLHPSIVREIADYNLRKKSKEIAQRLKFTEEKYQKFFDLNPSMIAVMSYPEEKFMEVNLSFIKTIGYNIEELHQRTSVELGILTADEHNKIKSNPNAFNDHFATNLICKDGKQIVCTINGTLTGENNNYLILVMTDITEKLKKDAEQKLLENKFYQDQKLQALGTLASGIAHDFNNILSIIIGNADFMLMHENLDTNNKSRLKNISQAGTRAAELIKQILTFARENKFTAHAVRLDKVVKETISMLKDIIPASIEIKYHINDVVEVWGDNNRFMQVITNLCVNASHAILDSKESGLIVITLKKFKSDRAFTTSHPDLSEDEYAMLSVDDNGCGIAKENLIKIFDPFFTTKKISKGTGLGLSTVYGIINEFKGKITVDSRVGTGTTFTIYLPILKDQADKVESNKPVSKNAFPALSGMVIFVDDEELLVEIGIKILEKMGLKVKGFTDPEAALDFFTSNFASIDLIITDLTMPKLGGSELLKKMRKYKSIPAIICSGQESNIIENKTDNSSNYFLMKPILINDLITTLNDILETS